MKKGLMTLKNASRRWHLLLCMLMLPLYMFGGTNYGYIDMIRPNTATITYQPDYGYYEIKFNYYYNPTKSAKDVSLESGSYMEVTTADGVKIKLMDLAGKSDEHYVDFKNAPNNSIDGYVTVGGVKKSAGRFSMSVSDGDVAHGTFRYYPPERLLGKKLSIYFHFKIEQDQDGESAYLYTRTYTSNENLPNVTPALLSSSVNFSKTNNKMAVTVNYGGSLPKNLYWGTSEFETNSVTQDYDRQNSARSVSIPITLKFSEYVSKTVNVTREIEGYQDITSFNANYLDAGIVNLSWTLASGTGNRYKNDLFIIERATRADFTDAMQIGSVGVNIDATSYSYQDDLIKANVFSPKFFYRITRSTTKMIEGWGWDFGKSTSVTPNYAHITVTSASAKLYTGDNDTIRVSWTNNNTSNLWTTGSEFIVIRENLTAGTRQQISGLSLEDLKRGYYVDRAIQQCNTYMYSVYVSPGNSQFTRNIYNTNQLTPTKMGHLSGAIASKGYHADRTVIEWESVGTFDQFAISRKVHGTDTTNWKIIKTVPGASVFTNYQESDETGLAGVIYDYKIVGSLMCSKQLITSNPVTTYGFRTPTGDFYGRVTFENGQGEDSVMVRLESDAILPGYSLEFNGSDSAVITNGELLRKATQAFTVQAWVSPNSGMQVGSILQKQNMFDLGLRNDNFYFTVNGTTITLDTMSVETMKRSANYIHLSGVYDNGVAKLYVNGRLAKEGNVSSSPAANSNAVVLGKGYQGYLDEVRLWGIALTPNTIGSDYYRYIVGNESGLEAYYTFNYTVDGEFYDLAYTDAEHHRNDGLYADSVRVSSVIPTSSQLGYSGITKNDGSYSICAVPYVGNGTSFRIIPRRGIHTFTPTQEVRFIGGTALSHTINFVDNSSFPVEGYVTYRGGTIPVKDAYFTIDGMPVMNTNGTYVYSEADGSFKINVPVGTHEVRVVKPGHGFERDGYITNLDGSPRNYQDRITGLTLIDTTLVKFVGRVSGGPVQNDYPLGHSLSTNNLASGIMVRLSHKNPGKYKVSNVDTTTLVKHYSSTMQIQEHYNYLTYSQDYIDISVNDSTGEFVAYVLPELYGITVTARGHNQVQGSGSDLNFEESAYKAISLSEYNYIDTIEIDGVKVPRDVTDTVCYNIMQKFSVSYDPSLYIAQTDEYGRLVPYFGQDSISTSLLNNTSHRMGVYNSSDGTYALGKPIFDMRPYTFFVKVSEVYNYYGSNNMVLWSDSVPTLGVEVEFVNNLSNKIESINVDSTTGTGTYSFYVGEPNRSSATSSISAKIKPKNARSIDWVQPFLNGEVYTIGRHLTGTNFVTSGPNKVLTVLRDPPGSNSYSFLEKGISFNESSTYTGSIEEEGYEGGVIQTGVKIKTFTGVGFGTITESEATTSTAIGCAHSAQYQGSDKKSSSTTITSRFQTSDSPDYVGAMADVYIGYATNVTFGTTQNVALVPKSVFNQAGGAAHYQTVYAENTDCALVLEKGTSIGQSFATMFAYPQVHIEEVLIPNLESIIKEQLLVNVTQGQLDSMLLEVQNNEDTVFYVSYWPQTSEHFGKINTDPSLKVYKSMYGDSTSYTDGPSYRMICHDNYTNSDTIATLSQWITDWKYQIGRNEYQKMQAIQDENALIQNYSFHAASPIEYSESYSTGKEHESTFNITVGLKVVHGSDVNVETGMKSRITFALEEQVTTTHGGTFTSEVEASHSKGFVLSEDGSDVLTVDVRHEKDWKSSDEDYSYNGNLSEGNTVGENDINKKEYYPSFIFYTQAGATSCPYEGEYKAKYLDVYNQVSSEKDSTYRPVNTDVVLAMATMQMEIPVIDVANDFLENVPSGDKAYFTLYMRNDSETQDDQWFDLTVVDQSNPDGAMMSIDGSSIGGGKRSYLVPAGGTLIKTLAVQKGRALNYDNLQLALSSQCQADPTSYTDVISDTVTFTVHYLPSCTDVTLRKPANNWTYNTKCAMDSINGKLAHYMPIELSGFNVNYFDFDHIELQYKPSSGSDEDWSTLMYYYANDSLYQIALDNNRNAMMISASDAGKIYYRFFMDDYSDQRYDLRAVSVCRINNTYYEKTSDISSGIKDMYNPRLFGSPQPANGVLTVEDDVRLNFNEAIAEGLLTNNNFQVTGIRNGAATNNDVSIQLDGVNGYLYTEANRNMTGKNFTMEMWINNTQPQQATLFGHGNINDYIMLSITATNHLQVNINGTVITSSTPVLFDGGTWAHVALTYDADNNKVNAYYNYTEYISNAIAPEYNGIGRFEVGRNLVTQSDYFNGKVDNFRVWSKVRSSGIIQVESNVQLSGNENALLSCYPMDEAKGNTTEDKARGAHLVIENATWSLPNGFSYRTNGNTNNYMVLDASAAAVTADMDYTIEFWFKAEPGQTRASMLSNGAGRGDATGSLNLFDVGFDSVGNLYYANNDYMIVIDGEWDDNNWHNFVLSVNRSAETARIYMDGNLSTYLPANKLGGISSDCIFVGARGWFKSDSLRTHDQFFRGNIDEIKLWQVYRRQSQIEAFSNEQLDGDELGLLAYYPFEEYQDNQGTPQLVSSLSDAKSQSVAKPAQVVGNVMPTNDNAPVKTKGAVVSLSYNFVTNNDALIINLTEDNYRIEKTIVTFTVSDVRDVNGNSILSPITWSAYIDRNQLKWQEEVINITKKQYQPYEFTAVFTNKGGSVQNYTLNNLPTWIETDVTSGKVNPLKSQEVVFTINEGLNIGTYNEVIYLTNDENVSEALELNVTVEGEKPDWDVNPADFEYSMSVFGKMRINNIFSSDKSDIIAVFQNGKCIGKTNCVYDKNLDMWYVMLTIYNNKPQATNLTYRIWDASTGITYQAVPDVTFNFRNGSIIGKPWEPVIFDAKETTYNSLQLDNGWNWISFNLANTMLSDINYTLQDGQWTKGDIVKTMDSTVSYSAQQQRWIGTLKRFNNKEMYWVKSSVAQQLPISGILIDTCTLSIKANQWNAISYLPQLNLPVKTALANYEAQEGDVIKGQNAFAMFYNNSWVGSLQYMEPGKGYMLRNTASINKTLKYPKVSATAMMSPKQKVEFALANNFNENMTIVATCTRFNEGDRISAYVDGELRGVAEVVAMDGHNHLFITVMAVAEGYSKEVLFVLESNNTQTISSTVLPYVANSMLGTVDNPVEIEFENVNAEISIYPIPYRQQVTVTGILRDETPVTIQFIDGMGRIVLQSQPVTVMQGGWFSANFNTTALPQGVYLIKVLQHGEIVSTQVTIKN